MRERERETERQRGERGERGERERMREERYREKREIEYNMLNTGNYKKK